MKYYQTDYSEGSIGSQGMIIAESLESLMLELDSIALYSSTYDRAVRDIEYKELEFPIHVSWDECWNNRRAHNNPQTLGIAEKEL